MKTPMEDWDSGGGPLDRYPRGAERWEFICQLILGIAFLAMAALMATWQARVPDPNLAERLAPAGEATAIGGISLVLALTAGFLRRWQKHPPLVLIWAALLMVAFIAGFCGILIFATVL